VATRRKGEEFTDLGCRVPLKRTHGALADTALVKMQAIEVDEELEALARGEVAQEQRILMRACDDGDQRRLHEVRSAERNIAAVEAIQKVAAAE